MKIGFDNDKYLAMQSAHIRERIAQFDNKLYLEFGGKLFDDYHASRVLPNSRYSLLSNFWMRSRICSDCIARYLSLSNPIFIVRFLFLIAGPAHRTGIFP